MSDPSVRFLVTGGAGFVGSTVAGLLVERGYPVRSLDLVACPIPGVESLIGDIRDWRSLERAVRDREVVLHCAGVYSLDPAQRQQVMAVNFHGNRRLFLHARERGVRAYIALGSSTTVLGYEPLRQATEDSAHYQPVFHNAWHESLYQAENDTILAHVPQNMATLVLRAGFIYGPGDKHFLPPLIERARKGQYQRLGEHDTRHSLVYVENLAEAMILAAERLLEQPKHGGQALFVGDHPPVNLFSFLEELFAALGLHPATPLRSGLVALGLARLRESVPWPLSRVLSGLPDLTEFEVRLALEGHTYSFQRFAELFAYQPRVGVDEAFQRTVDWLR